MSSSLLPTEGAVGWAAVANNAISAPQLNGFRLTLTTGTPVTTSDVTNAPSVFLSPHTSDRICLFDGTNWQEYSTAEISQSLSTAGVSGGALVNGTNYDVFAYDKAGAVTLETPFTAWTNDTTRATALVRQNGVWVKSGSATRRYVGTLRTTSTTATEDSAAQRFLWNMDNRVDRRLVAKQTGSWAYTIATWRAANANTTAGQGQASIVRGRDDEEVLVRVRMLCENGTANVSVSVGVALSTPSSASTTNVAQVHGGYIGGATGASRWDHPDAEYRGFPGEGCYLLQWLEISDAVGVTTWEATSNWHESGLIGSVRA